MPKISKDHNSENNGQNSFKSYSDTLLIILYQLTKYNIYISISKDNEQFE